MISRKTNRNIFVIFPLSLNTTSSWNFRRDLVIDYLWKNILSYSTSRQRLYEDNSKRKATVKEDSHEGHPPNLPRVP